MFFRLTVCLTALSRCACLSVQQPQVRVAPGTSLVSQNDFVYRISQSSLFILSNDDDSPPPAPRPVLKRIKGWLRVGDNEKGLTTRERLAKMGLSALLSYGWVSNMSYAVCNSLAWFTFNKQYGILSFGSWTMEKGF